MPSTYKANDPSIFGIIITIPVGEVLYLLLVSRAPGFLTPVQTGASSLIHNHTNWLRRVWDRDWFRDKGQSLSSSEIFLLSESLQACFEFSEILLVNIPQRERNSEIFLFTSNYFTLRKKGS